MDLRFAPEEIAFRDEVRAFLRSSLPDKIRQRTLNSHHATREDMACWQGILNDKGWAVPHWPREWGGTDWTPIQRYIFMEENALAPAPQPYSQNVNMIGPLIIAFGTEAQKARHLPRIASLEEFWCQGFSEPDAGSDLAALRTSARREGDHYIVNGQKIWTTHAHVADWMFCLVRTDPHAPRKQDGISMLLIDMKLPGLKIRRIETIDGWNEVNEIFFEDVRVPVDCRLGEENKGWTYARYLLSHERFGQSRIGASKARLRRAEELAATIDLEHGRLADDPAFRRRAATLRTELKALEILQLRALSASAGSPAASPINASILKMRGSELQQATTEILNDVAGPLGLPLQADWLEGEGETAAIGPEWAISLPSSYFYTRATSIYGGTNEIQRNLIARDQLSS